MINILNDTDGEATDDNNEEDRIEGDPKDENNNNKRLFFRWNPFSLCSAKLNIKNLYHH